MAKNVRSGLVDGLPLGGLTDEALAVVRESDDGRGRPRAFRILDDFRLRAFHHGDAGIGGAEVDTDDFTHGGIPHFQADRRAPKRPGPWLER